MFRLVEVALRPSRTASTTTLPVSAAPVTVPEHRPVIGNAERLRFSESGPRAEGLCLFWARAVAPAAEAAEAAEAGGCLCSLTGKLRGTSTGKSLGRPSETFWPLRCSEDAWAAQPTVRSQRPEHGYHAGGDSSAKPSCQVHKETRYCFVDGGSLNPLFRAGSNRCGIGV